MEYKGLPAWESIKLSNSTFDNIFTHRKYLTEVEIPDDSLYKLGYLTGFEFIHPKSKNGYIFTIEILYLTEGVRIADRAISEVNCRSFPNDQKTYHIFASDGFPEELEHIKMSYFEHLAKYNLKNKSMY